MILLWDINYKQINTSHFDAWSLFLIHVQFTHSKGPKGFKNCNFYKYDIGK